VTMPLRAITSERVCGTHPSARSPRTALHHGGVGASVHIRTGGDWARAKPESSSTRRVKRRPTRQIGFRKHRFLRSMGSLRVSVVWATGRDKQRPKALNRA
jgi:hypothetical protein